MIVGDMVYAIAGPRYGRVGRLVSDPTRAYAWIQFVDGGLIFKHRVTSLRLARLDQTVSVQGDRHTKQPCQPVEDPNPSGLIMPGQAPTLATGAGEVR